LKAAIKRMFKDFLPIYTLIWALEAGLVYLIFIVNNRSFLFISDGVYQHYLSFYSLCDYLLSIFRDHQFPGFYSFFLGQGNDVLTTLNSYDFTDPVCLITGCVFFISRIKRYTLMIFIKLYLVGLSFYCYCRAIDIKKTDAIIFGALSYTFSGAILFFFSEHPNFISWAYFFPFVLAGIELYRRKGRSCPLIIAVTFNIITNYYTFYMNAVLAVIYMLVTSSCRIIEKKERSSRLISLRHEIISWLLIAGHFIAGSLVSATVLIPTIIAYIDNPRVSTTTGYSESLLHYPVSFYSSFVSEFFAPFKHLGFGTILGLNPAILVPLVLVFSAKRKRQFIKWQIVILAAMIGMPIAGRVINGFGYATNRFTYAFTFFVSLSVTLWIDELKTNRHLFQWIIAAVIVSGCIIARQGYLFVKDNDKTRLVLITMIVLSSLIALYVEMTKRQKSLIVYEMVFIVCNCISILLAFSPCSNNLVSRYALRDAVEDYYCDRSIVAATVSEDNEKEFYRIETIETEQNLSLYHRLYGTTVWFSLLPKTISSYYDELGISPYLQNCKFGGLGSRADLMLLASTKYYTAKDDKEVLLPFGYEASDTCVRGYRLFENRLTLPLGYSYQKKLSNESFNNMNEVERGLALLQGVLLEEDEEANSVFKPKACGEVLPYQESDDSDLQVIRDQEGRFVFTTDRPGVSRVRFQVPDNREVFLLLKGVCLNKDYESAMLAVKRHAGEQSAEHLTRVSNPAYYWYVDRKNIVFDLGSGGAGENTIELEFFGKTEMVIDDIQIIAVSTELYKEAYMQLSQYTLIDTIVEPDHIAGCINAPDHRYLQLSVPYSRGWSAYIDGRKADLIRSDILYTTVEIDGGNHYIELYYHTPGLRAGLIISIFSVILMSVYLVIKKRKMITA